MLNKMLTMSTFKSIIKAQIVLKIPIQAISFFKYIGKGLMKLSELIEKVQSTDLEGLRSYRISRFRIIYRISSKQTIDIGAIGPRKAIYEETYRIIKKEFNPEL